MRAVSALFLLFMALPAAAARRGDSVEESFKKADELIEKGAYAKARQTLDEALAAFETGDSRLTRYHERTGAAWLREGKIRDARAAFAAALKGGQKPKASDNSVAKAYVGMGLCLRRENNDKYAVRFFKKALALGLDDGTKMFAEDQIREIEGSPPVPAT